MYLFFTSCCPLRHVPFNENHVVLIVIKSVRPDCIHIPLNDVEIEQVDDERPCGKKKQSNCH
jgi:hypothetical protein